MDRSDLVRFRREVVSFIFQTFNLFPTLTALENVQCGGEIAGSARESRRRAAEVLRQVGLGDRKHHYPSELSGGEQQRVAIARALVTDNPIIVADEPTGDLDFRTGVQILELLEHQTSAGRTVIVVTHNREISRVADRVIELSSGRIVSDGPPEGGRAPISDLRW
jgi:putative ABC transport system ATP-binding protein